nr:MAG TPA: hypothetical protein [Bacteriophage sp.]
MKKLIKSIKSKHLAYRRKALVISRIFVDDLLRNIMH